MTDSMPQTTRQPQPVMLRVTQTQRWAGRLLSGLAGIFLIFDGGAKLFKAAPVMAAMTSLGYPESTVAAIGTLLLVCTALYLIPRTAVLGAVLLSAYLGGATATNLRVSGPVFPIVFPVLLGMLVWTGLALCNERARSLFL